RPQQWIKNLFVFAPLIFSRELFLVQPDVLALRAFFAFCLTASAVYIINDMVDLEADRAHPRKRKRPIASGTISIPGALVLLGMLIVADVLLVWGMTDQFVLIVATYFVMNLAYTFKLKEVFLLDVFIIAAGFMLRVLGGAYAISVQVSSWIILCTLFISLFLGFAKRRGEIAVMHNVGAAPERKVLQHYRVEVIDQIVTITAAGTVIAYALYTVAPRTVEIFGTDKLIYTTIFVMYGIFRYMHLMHTTESVENPSAVVTTDYPIIINVVLWITTCVLLIYFKGQIPFLH
ncbi:MAG TPA: decaprenyl-phosphate phosphoribosyltransferase, partial [Bacteroidota bacterium]|nr:decaprenyl-phosphate phosphoribosyltransferase [Bacteroidota bacterium]